MVFFKRFFSEMGHFSATCFRTDTDTGTNHRAFTTNIPQGQVQDVLLSLSAARVLPTAARGGNWLRTNGHYVSCTAAQCAKKSYAHVHTYTLTHAYARIHSSAHMHTHVHMHAPTLTPARAYTEGRTNIHRHTSACTHERARAHTHVHTPPG